MIFSANDFGIIKFLLLLLLFNNLRFDAEHRRPDIFFIGCKRTFSRHGKGIDNHDFYSIYLNLTMASSSNNVTTENIC